MMKIVGFSGSLSSDSNTYKGVKAVLQAAEGQGAEGMMYDLREKPLPMYHPDDKDQLINHNVQEFQKLLLEADGIILGSPEYHNTVSGAFKNAVDWVGSTHFKNKPVALVSASGGAISLATLSTMQAMVRSLHGWVLPTFGSIGGNTRFHWDGSFADESMQLRFETMGKELVEMARLLKQKRGQ